MRWRTYSAEALLRLSDRRQHGQFLEIKNPHLTLVINYLFMNTAIPIRDFRRVNFDLPVFSADFFLMDGFIFTCSYVRLCFLLVFMLIFGRWVYLHLCVCLLCIYFFLVWACILALHISAVKILEIFFFFLLYRTRISCVTYSPHVPSFFIGI